MTKTLYFLFISILLLTRIPASFAANDVTQENAQNRAARINNRGSDDSMEAATTSGMNAVMNLAALNIGGAVHWGYKGYGQYTNSEKLDDLEIRTLKLQGKMTTVGQGLVKGGGGGGTRQLTGRGPSGVTGNTSFSRLDSGFLYKGQAAEVASEFERQSGMKRDEFLAHLSDATDSDISWEDPDLMQQLEARYQRFKSRVPNEKFRKGLETAETLVPPTARQELLGKFSKFYFDAWKDSPTSTPNVAQASSIDLSTPKSESTNSARPTASAAAPVSSAINSANPSTDGMNRTLASADEPSYKVERKMARMFIGLGSQNSQDTLNEYLANADLAEETIFLKVSKRYRLLTPSLSGDLASLEAE